MSEYTDQADNFLVKHNLKFRAVFLERDLFFSGDKEERDVYTLTLVRTVKPGKRVSFKFGQSIRGSENGDIPTAYDLLACLTKSDPGDFQNFCDDFGYDLDSRQAEKTFKSVKREWLKVSRFFSPAEIDELLEVQ